ncbi:MAG: winged helix-turn-helix domain-containing protein, partial [Gemmatimonadaceae bacterium]
MHYTDIADAITGGGLKSTLGATPAATVNSVINVSIDKEGNSSPFIRVKRGEYTLRALHLTNLPSAVTVAAVVAGPAPPTEDEEVAEPSAIQALGMFWRRELVNWTSNPAMLGQQQRNSKVVDF